MSRSLGGGQLRLKPCNITVSMKNYNMILLLQGCQIPHGIFDKRGRGSTYLSVYCFYSYVFSYLLVVTSCVRRIIPHLSSNIAAFSPLHSFIIYYLFINKYHHYKCIKKDLDINIFFFTKHFLCLTF